MGAAAAEGDDYLDASEPHDRGAILVAAVFDAFLSIYKIPRRPAAHRATARACCPKGRSIPTSSTASRRGGQGRRTRPQHVHSRARLLPAGGSVLGPPLSWEDVKKEAGGKGESYDHNKDLAMSVAFAAAVLDQAPGGSQGAAPFDNSYDISPTAAPFPAPSKPTPLPGMNGERSITTGCWAPARWPFASIA